jgi:3-methyladenine DNA glycosylase Tag
LSKNTIAIENVFNEIYLSVKNHYINSGLDVDQLIAEDISNSKKNKLDNLLYKRLVLSIHNANWKAVSQETFWRKNSINYEKAFNNYDANYVSKLKVSDLKNKGLINSERKIQYCINAAKFLVEIEKYSSTGVISFFEKYAYDGSSVYDRWALVNILAHSIDGIATALACDFLKETGFLNFGKPDVHIKRIFERIGLIDFFEEVTVYSNEDFFIFRILDILSLKTNKTLFEVDKILWLFATGFNNTNGKAIGGICKDKPDCTLCNINKSCQYFQHST